VVNVILLAGGEADVLRWCDAHPGVTLSMSVAALVDQSGTWHVVRTDRWQYDERTITALRQLAQRGGVELIDPTGLLGGSRYGEDAERRSIAATQDSHRHRTRVPRRPRGLGTQMTGIDTNDRTWK